MSASCQNPYCGSALPPFPSKRRTYCCKSCSDVAHQIRQGKEAGEAAAIRLGFLSACRIYYFSCGHCGLLLVKHYKRAGPWGPICAECKRRWYQAHDAKKNHARRAAGPEVIGIYSLAKRDGAKCHLCHRKVNMDLSGRAKWGPTIDHLVPVSKGGTNHPANLALAHRHCNTSRGNRGDVQLLLTALGA
jgi:hypothetical protein